MSDEQFTPEEQDLIRQLRAQPKPQINPAARTAIREYMVAEFRLVSASAPAPAPRQRPMFRPLPVLAAAAALVIAVVVIAQITRQPEAVSETATPPMQVAVVASETIAPSDIPALPSVTPTALQPTVTDMPPTLAAVPELPSATPVPTQQTTIIVEGPISAMDDNILTVYNLQIEIEPQHPILRLLEVGDPVRVEGTFSGDGVVMAEQVGNRDEIAMVEGEPVTVNVEGLVESIDDNQVVVNGITVELDPGDPILDRVRVGDFVSVQGNFERSGTAIVLEVVNIIIRSDVTTIESDCWYHDTGMGMGHWHCDGMGMGMGMGDAMGMGGMGMGR